ncbi:uncharacterized protein LOC133712604 [Rosa rugosa]|uniref:uncharacterized protein LOC133712604 n=1 Tax=Rosa rugosa TaxID=74645 RepID=UPI002B4145EC|nr:uncharacterized protein LOC133712604 [Rosa rugosa]
MEDSVHLFCKCPVAVEFFSILSSHLQNSILPNMVFKEWMLELAIHLKKEVFERLLMGIWSLWKNKNEMLWENTSKPGSALFLSSMTWLDEYKQARTSPIAPQPKTKASWQPAQHGEVKINVDGAFLPTLTQGGLGGVIRDYKGQFVASFAHPIQFVSSAKQVELLAIRAGLDLIQHLQLTHATIETDCLAAVQEITHEGVALFQFGSIVDDICTALHNLPQVRITFAPRTCNQVAHRLANLGFESDRKQAWYSQAPNCIRDVLHHDCNLLT